MAEDDIFSVTAEEEGEVRLNYSIDFGNPLHVADLLRFLREAQIRLERNLEVLDAEEMKERHQEILEQVEEQVEQAENLEELWNQKE